MEFEEDTKGLQIDDVEFGVKYTFSLKDAIDGCPEYLVNIKLLEKLCNEFDLELQEVATFNQFRKKNFKKNESTWNSLHLNKLTAPEREVIGLYQIFAFRKTEGETKNINYIPKSSNEIIILQ